MLELRKKLNLTQEAVATAVGITISSYSHYERGEREPDFDTLKKLADFFDISIDYLLGREKPFDGLNIIQRPLDTRKTDIQIAFDAMNERQQNKLLDYARGLLAGEDINLDELLRRAK